MTFVACVKYGELEVMLFDEASDFRRVKDHNVLFRKKLKAG